MSLRRNGEYCGYISVKSAMAAVALLFASPSSSSGQNGSANLVEKRPHALKWDATEKKRDAKPGEPSVEFTFNVTNTSAEQSVTIFSVGATCGCTAVELPKMPWVLAPGAAGVVRVVVDVIGRHGRLEKGLEVDSSGGAQTLLVHVNIPPPDAALRQRNQEFARADRQAVFRNECAKCHLASSAQKTGGELFQTACVICHGIEHRASMVPALLPVQQSRDAAYWRKWIADGREQTLMPAFAREHGGPLSNEQIESLVKFLLEQSP